MDFQIFFDFDNIFRAEDVSNPIRFARWKGIREHAATMSGINVYDLSLSRRGETVTDYDEEANLEDGDIVSVTWNLPGGLYQAVQNGNLPAVRRWVAHGVEVDIRDDSRQTPLMWATAHEHPKIVEALL